MKQQVKNCAPGGGLISLQYISTSTLAVDGGGLWSVTVNQLKQESTQIVTFSYTVISKVPRYYMVWSNADSTAAVHVILR